jgi:hypothetical protein
LLSCMHATYPSFAGCRRGQWRAALAFCGLSRFQAQRGDPVPRSRRSNIETYPNYVQVWAKVEIPKVMWPDELQTYGIERSAIMPLKNSE